jgi:fumarylpyruvate hydrolase
MAFGPEMNVYKSADDASKQVKNVFCVGRNFQDHALELGNQIPSTPMIFGKPTHAVVPATGVLMLPEGRHNVHHELEVVLWVKQPYVPGISVEALIGGVALGLDLTDRDAQAVLKEKGHPWEFAKGFRGSAVLSDFYQVSNWAGLPNVAFSMRKNDKVVQLGCLRDMIFSLQTLVDYVGHHFGLDKGDIVFAGTPAGVGRLEQGDAIELFMADACWARFRIG